MSASEQSPTTPTTVSTPLSGSSAGAAAGTGAVDLATESNDPQELRALLDRARERLSFYESFDRIIGENLRRTGEMMAETVALREQAARAIRERQAVDEALRADRERYRTLIAGALDEVRSAQPVIESMMTRLQSALDELAADTAPSTTIPSPAPEVDDEPEASHPETVEDTDIPPVETVEEGEPVSNEPPADPEPEATETVNDSTPRAKVEETRPEEEMLTDTTPDNGPREMDVLAHGVPSANVAIGLQNVLRGLDQVSTVEAREFADGELRLHLALTGALSEDVLANWLTANDGTLTSFNGKAIELTFS